jgi:hypothetical protein
MTEYKQKFRVKQNLNINGLQRTVEFSIEEISENTEQIVLQATENNARTLAIGVIREIVTGEDNKTHNKFIVNIDRFTSSYEAHITTEIVDSEKEFFWFNIPVSNLTAMLHERGFEALVNEFTRDLASFLSKYITVKKDEK